MEVSALTGKNLNKPKINDIKNNEIFELNYTEEDIIDDNGIYTVTEIKNIDNTNLSPNWLTKRLNNSGVKSINFIVDLTNYVMLEQGQPMHAFDADKLKELAGRDIKVSDLGLRKSKKGEIIKLLDNKDHKIENIVDFVTCNDIPIAIAGVIGGYNSSVTVNTKNIWLESALFSAKSVRNSSRSIGIRTESSSRYEKGISSKLTISTVSRFLDLLDQKAINDNYKTYIDRPLDEKKIELILRRTKINKILGMLNSDFFIRDNNSNKSEPNNYTTLIDNYNYIPNSIVVEKLTLIGCQCIKLDNETWKVLIPPHREKDLLREIDLIEEIARLVGYDNFNANLPVPIKPGGLNSQQICERKIRGYLVTSGLQEITTMSLVGQLDKEPNRIPISNPLLKETSVLRTNLWEEHIEIVKRNLSSGSDFCWIYEIGNIYLKEKNKILEKKLLGGVLNGKNRLERWTSGGKKTTLDYFEARGKLEETFLSLNIQIKDIPNTGDSLLHPGRASKLNLEGTEIGYFGQLHPSICQKNDLNTDTYLFEIELNPIITSATRKIKLNKKFRQYPTVPFMERDISLIVDASCNSSEIISVITKSGKPLLEKVELVDRYSGRNLPTGKISQAFRIRYRDSKKTLTEEDIQPIHQKIRTSLEKTLNAQLRS